MPIYITFEHCRNLAKTVGQIGTIMDNVVFLRLEKSVQEKWGINQ
ncbi:hypothetical protein [Sporosarcina jiandibaonis]|nr:hypothetical protein [Sporosarcina jiandibaonis]